MRRTAAISINRARDADVGVLDETMRKSQLPFSLERRRCNPRCKLLHWETSLGGLVWERCAARHSPSDAVGAAHGQARFGSDQVESKAGVIQCARGFRASACAGASGGVGTDSFAYDHCRQAASRRFLSFSHEPNTG